MKICTEAVLRREFDANAATDTSAAEKREPEGVRVLLIATPTVLSRKMQDSVQLSQYSNAPMAQNKVREFVVKMPAKLF